MGPRCSTAKTAPRACARTRRCTSSIFNSGNDTTILASCASYGGTWSPDSQQIAFVRFAGQNDTSGELAVAKADGTNQHAFRTASNPGELTWSPDGSRIAYTAGGPARQLHVMRADGTKDILIAHGRAPQWSPDGKQLAFLWDRGNVAADSVTIINRDGTHPHLVDATAVDPYSQGIGWSPDGRTIVYRTENPPAACSCMNLYVERIDGSNRHRIVRGVEHQEFGPLYWSRDGKTVIYTSYVQHGE